MTIFQKMLVLPLLSLVLYSGFILYSYTESQRSNENIKKIRDDYLPLLELANDNTYRFGEISDAFKDAVVADEVQWVYDNVRLKNRIEANFSEIENYPHIVKVQDLQSLKDSFDQYYTSARALSLALLDEENNYTANEALFERVELFYNRCSQLFTGMKNNIRTGFKQTVDQTHETQQQLVVLGSLIAAVLLVGLASVVLFTSFTPLKKLHKKHDRMQSLAQGDSDFSRRLDITDSDELGTLTHWFNKLSEKLEKDYKNIELISITDKLTGLNNRTRTDVFLDECIHAAHFETTDLSVILLDVDNFKAVNDNYGHLTGDKVLIAVGETLKKHVDANDFIGRWGGEEFILVLPNKTAAASAAQAEAIRSAIESTPMPTVGRVTASFGISYLEPNESRDSLLTRTDDALYQAKREGRNRVCIAAAQQ